VLSPQAEGGSQSNGDGAPTRITYHAHSAEDVCLPDLVDEGAVQQGAAEGVSFKFFSECLNLQLIRAALVAEGTDVLADGDRATHLDPIFPGSEFRVFRVFRGPPVRGFPTFRFSE